MVTDGRFNPAEISFKTAALKTDTRVLRLLRLAFLGARTLARLVRTFPNATFTASARDALRQSLTAENIAQEAFYLRAEGRASFERPYGLAWLLQLVAELFLVPFIGGADKVTLFEHCHRGRFSTIRISVLKNHLKSVRGFSCTYVDLDC